MALAANVFERASQVQRELATLEGRVDILRAMFDQAPGFVAFLEGQEHRYELTNRAYDRMIAGRKVVGRTVREALPELAGQGYYELLDQVYASGEPFLGESMRVELVRPGSSITDAVYLDFLYQPVIGVDGATRGMLLGVSKRILVVDDNQDAALLLAELLERRGHEVHVAHDGLDAVRQAIALTPNIALIDIGLPTIDGYEVARRVGEELGTRAPRMIALTGYGAPHDRENSRRAGFEMHLTKPAESSRLLALIDRASAA